MLAFAVSRGLWLPQPELGSGSYDISSQLIAAVQKWTCTHPHAALKFSPSPFFSSSFQREALNYLLLHSILYAFAFICVYVYTIYIYIYIYLRVRVFILVLYHISVNI